MAQNEITQALQLDSVFTRSTLADAVLKRGGYCVLQTEDTRTLQLGSARVLFRQGQVYERDDADATTAHDGITCLVSQDGVRFKSMAFPSMLAVTEIRTAPPSSPALGDLVLIDIAPTGPFAAYAKYLAAFTLWGWRFIAPRIGQIIYVRGSSLFYHYSNDGSWVQGFGSSMLADGSVWPTSLIFPMGISALGPQNSPPGTPYSGLAVLVGTSPLGTFIGHNNKLALYKGSTWVFYTAYEGAVVWSRTNLELLVFKSGLWALAQNYNPLVAESPLYSNDSALAGAASPGAADFSVYWQTASPVNRLKFVYRCNLSTDTQVTISLFKNSEAVAQDYALPILGNGGTIFFELFHTPGDISLHKYTIRIDGSSGSSVTRRRLYIQEIAG